METLHTRLGRRPFSLLLAGAPFFGHVLSRTYVAAQTADDAKVALMRGDAAQTGRMPGPAPDDAPEQLWFVPGFNGRGYAPLVAGNLVFGMFEGGDALVALDADTGAEIWRVERGGLLMLPAIPTAADGLVSITARETGGDRLAVLLALDVMNGEEVWRLRLPHAEHSDEWTSPLAADGALYLAATTGMAYALDAGTGEEIWSADIGNATFPPPALAGGHLVFIHDDNLLVALDAATGEEEWRGGVEDQVISLAIEDGLILAVTERASSFGEGDLHAIDLETGEERWKFSGDEGISAYRSPAVANGLVYVSGRVDTFCALNLETGEVRWQLDDAFAAGAPVIVGEALYLTIGDDLFALDAATGEEIWSVEDWLGENYEVLSPLVISGGRIVINAGQGLAAFGAPGS